MELAGSLLSAGAPKPAGSPQRAEAQGLSGEMLRSMRFAGVISALIGAMELLDADHPQVCYQRTSAPFDRSYGNSMSVLGCLFVNCKEAFFTHILCNWWGIT